MSLGRQFLLNLKIAIRSLCGFRLRSLLAVAGVFLGTLSLVIVANMSDSLTLKTEKEIEKLGKNLLVVKSKKVKKFRFMRKLFTSATTLTEQDAMLLKSIEGVEDVMPATNRLFPVRYKDRTLNNILVVGVTVDFPRIRNFYPATGRFFTKEEDRALEKVVLLGKTTAERLFKGENPLGKYIYIYRAPCRVLGVMETKGVDATGTDQDNQIIMPLRTYLRRFVNKDHINMIYVRVRNERLIPKVKSNITELLRKSHRIGTGKEDDFEVIDPKDFLTLKTEALKIVRTIGRLAAAVAFVIGGIGILSIMILLVNERRIEIGIRRAVGSHKKDIIGQFLFESTFISVAGGALGVVAGFLLCVMIYLLTPMPFAISVPSLILAFSASIVVGISAGVYPSFKATMIQPIEVLRE